MKPDQPKIHLRNIGGSQPLPPAQQVSPEPIRSTRYRHSRFGSMRLSRGSRRRLRLRWLWLLVLVPVAVMVIALGYGWWQWGRIQRVDDLVLLPPGNVETILFVGSDTRQDLREDEPGFGGQSITGDRADTIMLMVLPPGHEKATMLSIPRDLRVTYQDKAGKSRTGKINGAFNGGPATMVGAVQAATGLTVNHFVQVNFDGFRDLSSAVGGVEICVDTPVEDAYSGLDLPAGCHNLEGDQALAWVRSRHFKKIVDGKPVADPTGDAGRIKRQQEFMTKLVAQMASPSAVLHLGQLSSAAQMSFRLDPGFSYWHMLRLGYRFLPSPSQKLQFVSLPGDQTRIGGLSYVVKTQASEEFLAQLRSGQVPSADSK